MVQHSEAEELHVRRRVCVFPHRIGIRGWGGPCDIRTGTSLAIVVAEGNALLSFFGSINAGIVLLDFPGTGPVQSDIIFACTQRSLLICCAPHTHSHITVQEAMPHF